MQDLNDLYYFARVVEHRGFAAAGRAIGVPKSKLSRRIALLEQRLGARLLQRSTRRFTVTEVGEAYYQHCRAMVAEAEEAVAMIDRFQTEPQGTVRISCPVLLAQDPLTDIVSNFLTLYPRVRIHIDSTNRRVDVIEEGVDIAIRVRAAPLEDSGLVVRILADDHVMLVASPGYLDRVGRPTSPQDLSQLDSLAMTRAGDDHQWRLLDAKGDAVVVRHRPRLVTDEMITLRRAAIDGIGVTGLPRFLVDADIAERTLEHVLPDWAFPRSVIHAAFASRRGLLPAVRLFIDFLTDAFERLSPEECARARAVDPGAAATSRAARRIPAGRRG